MFFPEKTLQSSIQQDIFSFWHPAKSKEHDPPLSHFDHLVWWLKTTVLAPSSILIRDPLISTTKCHLVPFYIKHLCIYYRYLEYGKSKLWAWYCGSWIVVMLRVVNRNKLFRNQITSCQQVFYFTSLMFASKVGAFRCWFHVHFTCETYSHKFW